MSSEKRFYIVESGDTLSGIARLHGFSSWQDLHQFNGHIVAPNRLYPGDVIYLPEAPNVSHADDPQPFELREMSKTLSQLTTEHLSYVRDYGDMVLHHFDDSPSFRRTDEGMIPIARRGFLAKLGRHVAPDVEHDLRAADRSDGPTLIYASGFTPLGTANAARSTAQTLGMQLGGYFDRTEDILRRASQLNAKYPLRTRLVERQLAEAGRRVGSKIVLKHLQSKVGMIDSTWLRSMKRSVIRMQWDRSFTPVPHERIRVIPKVTKYCKYGGAFAVGVDVGVAGVAVFKGVAKGGQEGSRQATVASAELAGAMAGGALGTVACTATGIASLALLL